MDSSAEYQSLQQMSDPMPDLDSPKVWTQLMADHKPQIADHKPQMADQFCNGDGDGDEQMADQQMPIPHEYGHQSMPMEGHEDQGYGDQSLAMVPYVDPDSDPNPPLYCMQSGDGTDYSAIMAVVQSERCQRPYCPSTESRQLHNHKERLRRSRMKCSCDALRALVPGLSEKTDKATVLEHTVAFLFHLSKCEGVKCDDYVPTFPPPMSAKLLDLYPTLMAGEYRYYEAIPSVDPDYVDTTADVTGVTDVTEEHDLSQDVNQLKDEDEDQEDEEDED